MEHNILILFWSMLSEAQSWLEKLSVVHMHFLGETELEKASKLFRRRIYAS